MSAVVRTLTPFTEQDVLIDALEALGVVTTLQGQNILTDRKDYQGHQKFVRVGGVYQFTHDSDELSGRIVSRSLDQGYTPVWKFLTSLEMAYKRSYQVKLRRIEEAARLKLEQERLARVEATRLKAIEKAKAQGYQVKEHRKNGKIQLVLTRTVY